MSSSTNGSAPLASHSLVDAFQSTNKSSFSSDAERVVALREARKMCYRLETPIETITRMCWTQPTVYGVVRVAMDLKFFHLLCEDDGTPKSCAYFAEKTGADPMLLGRMIRIMAGMGIIDEAGQDQFIPNEFSRGMCLPEISGGIPACFDTMLPSIWRLPEFLAKTGYKNPEDQSLTPFKFGHGSDKDFWAFLKERPELEREFGNHMKGYALAMSQFWTQFYPVKERLIDGFEHNSVFMVDVGGSTGHDVQRFQTQFPEVKGRMIVQDQPQVVQNIATSDKSGTMEAQGHDFFTQQPVEGARVYYLHSILHDWADAPSISILEALRPAMKPGYSKLLIYDYVIEDVNANVLATSLDCTMMVLVTAQERTEGHWRSLLKKAGYKVTGIWQPEGATGQGIVEAEVA